MSKIKKILIVALFVIGFFNLLGIIGFSYASSTNYMLEIDEAVYLDVSEIRYNGDKESLANAEVITSVTVTLVNVSNKDFNDVKVRLMYYNDSHQNGYPEGYSLYNKIIDIEANGETIVTFTEFRNVWYYNDEFRVGFDYDENNRINHAQPDWEQIDYGYEFEYYYDKAFLLAIIACSVVFASCLGVAIILLLNNKKKEN